MSGDDAAQDPQDHAGEQAVWADLTTEEKRERVLVVAGELFSARGLQLPMPELARHVGAGVGSLYRLFGSKEDVVAMLVATRLEELADRYEEAARAPDVVDALVRTVREVVQDCVEDHLTVECWQARDDPAVLKARARAIDALDQLVEAARTAGAITDDATGRDFRALFRSANSAELIEAGGSQRLAELVLRGLGLDEARLTVA